MNNAPEHTLDAQTFPNAVFSACLKVVPHFISLVKTTQTLLFIGNNTSENSLYSALFFE